MSIWVVSQKQRLLSHVGQRSFLFLKSRPPATVPPSATQKTYIKFVGSKNEKEHSEEFYYEIRNKDRSISSYNRLSDYTKAARTIYLNKACFNGLYRVNGKNQL